MAQFCMAQNILPSAPLGTVSSSIHSRTTLCKKKEGKRRRRRRRRRTYSIQFLEMKPIYPSFFLFVFPIEIEDEGEEKIGSAAARESKKRSFSLYARLASPKESSVHFLRFFVPFCTLCSFKSCLICFSPGPFFSLSFSPIPLVGAINFLVLLLYPAL